MTNKEAIRRILDHKRVHSLNEPRAVLINEALDLAIKALEERPQGEWIFRQGVTCGGYYKCNKCGEVERAEKNFCPNCGSKMQKGKEE